MRILTILLSMIVGAAIAYFVGMKMLPSKMLSETVSPLGFEETVTKIEENAKAAGWKVPEKWKANFQANFKKVVGTDIGPMKLIKMCEPQAAVDILSNDDNKVLSVMMPCTVAVYQKGDGKTYIGTMNMNMLGTMFGGEVAEAVKTLAPQMDAMIKL